MHACRTCRCHGRQVLQTSFSRARVSPRRAPNLARCFARRAFFFFELDDRDAGLAVDARKQLQEIVACERYAAFRRLQSVLGDMHEDRASLCAHARAAIVVKHHDDIVKPVLSPKAFGARRIGVFYGAVVVAVIRCVAPSVIGPCLSQRDGRSRTAKCVAPPEGSFELERAAWSRAISLAFSRANSAASECAA